MAHGAHEVVLDVFEKRLKVYHDLRAAIGAVMRSGMVTNAELFAYLAAQDAGNFLFGDDVRKYFEKLRITFIDLAEATAMMSGDNLPDDQVQKWVAIKHEKFAQIGNFYNEFGKLAAPYMRIDAKLPATRPWFSR